MTNEHQASQAAPSESETPTWDELRAEGCVVVDEKYEKLAIYVGGEEGHVVILSQNLGEEAPNFNPVHCSHVPSLVQALQQAEAIAKVHANAFERKMDAIQARYLNADAAD